MNDTMEVVVLMFTSSSLHNLGAAYAKLWHPNFQRAFGMISKFQVSDLNDREGV